MSFKVQVEEGGRGLLFERLGKIEGDHLSPMNMLGYTSISLAHPRVLTSANCVHSAAPYLLLSTLDGQGLGLCEPNTMIEHH